MRGWDIQVADAVEANTLIGGVEELRLIEGDQRSVSMGIIRGWFEVPWVEVAQKHHSRLIIALDDERRLVLAAIPDRETCSPLQIG